VLYEAIYDRRIQIHVLGVLVGHWLKNMWGNRDEAGQRQSSTGILDIFFVDAATCDHQDAGEHAAPLRPRQISFERLLARVLELDDAMFDARIIEDPGRRLLAWSVA